MRHSDSEPSEKLNIYNSLRKNCAFNHSVTLPSNSVTISCLTLKSESDLNRLTLPRLWRLKELCCTWVSWRSPSYFTSLDAYQIILKSCIVLRINPPKIINAWIATMSVMGIVWSNEKLLHLHTIVRYVQLNSFRKDYTWRKMGPYNDLKMQFRPKTVERPHH